MKKGWGGARRTCAVIPGRRASAGPGIHNRKTFVVAQPAFYHPLRAYGFRARPSGRPGMTAAKPTLRRPVVWLGLGTAGPFFRFPRKREWSAGRRQGFARPLGGSRCVNSGLPGEPCLSGVCEALLGRACETHPEAAAGDDLKACEALPPSRRASQRSISRCGFSPHPPRRTWPDLRPVPRPFPLGPPRHDGGGRAGKEVCS